MEAKLEVEVVSLGIVERDGSPRIHYPPGRYEVAADIAAALRAQGALAPEAAPAAEEPPPAEAAPSAGGRKGKGA